MGKGEARQAQEERGLLDDRRRKPISAADDEGDALDATFHSTLEPLSELGARRLPTGRIQNPRLEPLRQRFLYGSQGLGVAPLRNFSNADADISPNASKVVVDEGAKVGLLDLARRYDPEAHLPL